MRIERFDADRAALAPLFAMADDSPSQVAAYLAQGDVFVAREGDALIGYSQILIADGEAVFELKSIAVIESRRGEGVGRKLIEAAIAYCRHRNGHRLIVSTATADIENLRFYQRRGFRMYKIVQDAFCPSTGYAENTLIDGIPLRDQVYLEYGLNV